MKSIKNFILEDFYNQDEVLMFGKLEENKYRLDVSYPFDPYTALGVAISSFGSKTF